MTEVHTKKWWEPHNPKSYQNVYFNENLLQSKWKISCFLSFQLKSTQTRGFSIMCWLLTKYDKVKTYLKQTWKIVFGAIKMCLNLNVKPKYDLSLYVLKFWSSNMSIKNQGKQNIDKKLMKTMYKISIWAKWIWARCW